jgi:hypothetical protein
MPLRQHPGAARRETNQIPSLDIHTSNPRLATEGQQVCRPSRCGPCVKSGRPPMARKPDTPCSRCGSLLYSGKTSASAASRVCLPCRRTSPATGRRRPGTCVVCEQPTPRSDQQTCSAKCFTATVAIRSSITKPRACGYCGKTFMAGTWRRYCSPCVVLAKKEENRRKNGRRRGLRPSEDDRAAHLKAVADRDGWRCHLCRLKVDFRLVCPDPMSPSIDHLIPVADGGTEDAANLRLAHFGCNSRRGAGGVVQLLLFG